MAARCPCSPVMASPGLRPRYAGNDFYDGME